MGGGAVDWKKPEYSRYTVDKVPKLVELQKQLKAEGLRDPWLRNHVWKFMGPHKTVSWLTFWKHPGVFQGIAYGIAFTGFCIAADQLYGLATGRKSDDKGHH